MKKTFTALLIIISFVISKKTHAQTNIFPNTDAAGIGTATPNASSLLEIKSTKKGLLIPRITIAQRNAIASHATGYGKMVDTKANDFIKIILANNSLLNKIL